jgi:hypothetical protein
MKRPRPISRDRPYHALVAEEDISSQKKSGSYHYRATAFFLSLSFEAIIAGSDLENE